MKQTSLVLLIVGHPYLNFLPTLRRTPDFYMCINDQLHTSEHIHGSHWDWKTWKNGKAFSSQGKVREFCLKYWKNRKF